MTLTEIAQRLNELDPRSTYLEDDGTILRKTPYAGIGYTSHYLTRSDAESMLSEYERTPPA